MSDGETKSVGSTLVTYTVGTNSKGSIVLAITGEERTYTSYLSTDMAEWVANKLLREVRAAKELGKEK